MKSKISDFWRRAKEVLLPGGSDHRSFNSVRGRSLCYEPLEPRMVLSAAGLVDVGTQPDGALSGKIVYTHAGHGYTTFDNTEPNPFWAFQRGLETFPPDTQGMIEDLGNQDQMTFFADYLFRAGATVVPLRPVGHQPNEVILDNDDPEVTFSGSWSNSSSSIYFGDPGDVPYRFASTSATETAFARYRPDIPEAGFYPVYAWTRYGSDRAEDQLYRVNHSGGITEVTVNHRRVGNGPVYLGTYHFEAGTDGFVDISNRSNDPSRVVIADMIRFGNGVGDIDRGDGVSGRDREDEAGLYWVQWHVDRSQGILDSEYRTLSDDRDATVSLSPRYSEYMNRESDGLPTDRVFVSFHSNGFDGTDRGVLGLYNGNNNPSTATPNQFLLANTLGREVNDDLVAQNGQFEHNWFDQGPNASDVTLDRTDIEFGEINNLRIGGEFDATIIETGYHDNEQDSEMLRDAKVRDALARATYQGVVKYFNNVDGGATPIDMLPGQITEVSAEAVGSGSVTVSWDQPIANSANGDAPTGYMIYGSTNGYGFDGGTFVAGAGTLSHTLNGLDTTAYYFKVAAVNAGGEGKASEVVAATPNGSSNNLLIVNGFDRFGRQLNPVQAGAERVRPRQSNSFDYAVQVASAIEAYSTDVKVDTASNEKVISGDILLGDYQAVVWILGEESSADDTFNATEQTLVSNFLSGGGKLFVSGGEIGWDLDWLNNGRAFYNNSLRADYVADDANTYNVAGVGGSIFAGLSFSFDDGTQGFYDVTFPDVISPLGGATTAMTYVGGTGGGAAIQYDSGGSTKVVNFGFPFETITTESNRNAVMERVLDFFGFDVVASADFDGSGFIDGLDFLKWQLGQTPGGGSQAELALWETQFGGPAPLAAASEDLPAQAFLDDPAELASLSLSGLVDFVAHPAGALDGKIVFTSAGHGWQWSNALNRWATDRGDNNEIVEDFGNQDQLTYFADYLLRAGATVVPMRPVGHQLNEVVLDNDLAEVTYTGSWSDSTSSVFYDEDYGAVADSVPYRFASISGTETATATYTPNIPEAGFYPVYTWVLDSINRANQLYRIHDSAGGVTEVRVDHRMVGKGWVYLGTYHFDAGTTGSVEISNQSTDGGSFVIADAIRFGNGMGDMLDGPSGVGHPSGTISGEPREDENSMMWTWRAIGQGNNAASVIGTGNVSAPSRMAEHMNANTNPFGTSVYIGFHSNAGGGRGAVGLIDVDIPEQTPNQPELALYTGRQINQDMQALNGLFEHNWSTRTTHTFTGEFGEINEGQGAEMDMTIIETAFHDSSLDAQLMRDPKVRDQLARSTYEAVLEYFDNFGGLTSPVSQPSAPTGVTATTNVSGDITVSWTPGPTGVQGGTPTAHRVYVSRDGYGFLGYVEVAGAGAGSHTFDAADLDNDMYYFKVVAVNDGGESPRSAVTAARKSDVSGKRILIVDGYDRNDRPLNERYPYAFTGDGLVDRVRTRYNNSFDYVAQFGDALDNSGVGANAAQNEAVISGAVSLSDYDAVMWFLGEESSVDDTFNVTEQTLVSNYLSGGGQLFVSGAEIGWDLDNLGNGVSFYNNQLRANYVADDANTYNVTGVGGSIFAGLSFSFDDGSLFYDVTFPDVISPLGGATTALTYVGGTGGGAAIQYDSGGATKVVNFGFPFETITTAADRQAVMDQVLEFFGLNVVPSADFDGSGFIDGLDFLKWQLGQTPGGGSQAELALWETQYGGPAPLVAASEALSVQEATSDVTAAPAIAVSSPASSSDDSAALAGVAQFASLAEEKSARTPARVVESTEHLQDLQQQPIRLSVPDGDSDPHGFLLERIRSWQARELEQTDFDEEVGEEAFSRIGDDERFDSHLFKI